MGLYLNPKVESFANLIQSDIYVDKTGLIAYMNSRIGKEKHLIASSRPRRFGKTMAVKMLTAYYSKGCSSRELFRGLEISNDSSFDKHLNKYDVICLDIQWMRGIAISKKAEVLEYIQGEVLKELRQEYYEYIEENETSVAAALASIYNSLKVQFIIIIDEWDCLFREDKDNLILQASYISFLRGLFKGRPADEFVKLGYITGILPIKKYGTQSALNNFKEFTMISSGMIARYIGFTESEVQELCENHDMSFHKMQEWYDGYFFKRVGHIYSPNSVMEAIDNEDFENYWTGTETYESLMTYIAMDFHGLKQMIVDMLGGQKCKIDVASFQNDITSFRSASDVLTLLVHLGYLAYDDSTDEVFIPNEEVRSAFILSIKTDGWNEVYRAIYNSEELLKATLDMNETIVAQMIQQVHTQNSSSLVYNNEISLASVISLAYYSATKNYILIREMPTGDGFADMVFLPKPSFKKPAIIVELKWNKTTKGAIEQIKQRKYVQALKSYVGEVLLVGINYNKKTKKHECKIEKCFI